jgi:hypothetical protein
MQQFWISKRWKESIIYKELWYNRTQMNNRNGTSFSCLSAYSNTETTCFNIKWHMFWKLIKERLEPDWFFFYRLVTSTRGRYCSYFVFTFGSPIFLPALFVYLQIPFWVFIGLYSINIRNVSYNIAKNISH